MIIRFLIDYLVMILLPINSYLMLCNLDDNKIYDVVFIGLIIDALYGKILVNVVILVIIYFIIRKINFKKKYSYLKNLFIFMIYFNLSFFLYGVDFSKYLMLFLGGVIIQSIYLKVCKLV